MNKEIRYYSNFKKSFLLNLQLRIRIMFDLDSSVLVCKSLNSVSAAAE